MKIDLPYLNYILDIIKNIETSIYNISIGKFKSNIDLQDANIRRIEIITESIKNISKELKAKYTKVDWEKIEKMNGLLSNRYFGIDIDYVWVFIKEDISNLKKEILKIKEDLNKKPKD